MGIVTGVENVVLDTKRVLSQSLKVVRPNEPFAIASFFLGHIRKYVLIVVISREIERVRGGHIVVDQGIVFNDTEFLSGVEDFALVVSE